MLIKTSLKNLLEEIGVEKDKAHLVTNAIFDKLPHFNEGKDLDEDRDLQQAIALRVLHSTTIEAKNNLTNEALKKQQAKLVSRSQDSGGRRPTGTSAKNAWDQ